jgi:hypothetical protein
VFDFRRSSAPPQEASQPAQRSGLTASEQWPNGPARSHQIHKLSTSPVARPPHTSRSCWGHACIAPLRRRTPPSRQVHRCRQMLIRTVSHEARNMWTSVLAHQLSPTFSMAILKPHRM